MRVQGKEIDNTAFKMIQTSSLPQMRSSNFQTTTGNNRHKNFSFFLLRSILQMPKEKEKRAGGKEKEKKKRKKSCSKLSILSFILPR